MMFRDFAFILGYKAFLYAGGPLIAVGLLLLSIPATRRIASRDGPATLQIIEA